MLSTIFDSKVVSKIDHLSALAAACRSAEDESDFSKGRSRHTNLHEKPSQEDLLRMTVNKPKTSSHVFFSRPFSRQLWGTTKETTNNSAPWKECADDFHQEIHRVVRLIAAEVDSLTSIQSQLSKQCQDLEYEVCKEQAAADTMFSCSDSSDLVDHLSCMLLQRHVNGGNVVNAKRTTMRRVGMM